MNDKKDLEEANKGKINTIKLLKINKI